MRATKKKVKAINQAFAQLRDEMGIYPSELAAGDENVTIEFPRDEIDLPVD